MIGLTRHVRGRAGAAIYIDLATTMDAVHALGQAKAMSRQSTDKTLQRTACAVQALRAWSQLDGAQRAQAQS